jgi:hypothetical protein
MFVKPLQKLNVPSSMHVTPDGISILVMRQHPLNASFPILITLEGIFMFVKSLHPKKA